MTVREFLGMAVNSNNYYLKIFDCTKWAIVFDEREHTNVINEVERLGFNEYEVTSYEIYDTVECIILELNICM